MSNSDAAIHVFVIRNALGQYWSHEQGWVARASATEFTREERETVHLPIGGVWKRSTTPRTTRALTPGDPFPCPNCGQTEDGWTASYYDPATQGVVLVVGEDGKHRADDWLGDGGHVGDATEDESYACRGCGHEIREGEFRLIPAGRALDDAHALDRLQRMLSGRRWDGAADLLDAIAGVIRGTGRTIAEAGPNGASWREAV